MRHFNFDNARPLIESEIQRLTDMLDAIDADPDFEEGDDDEPWLGDPEARTGSWNGLCLRDNDDREEDGSNRELCRIARRTASAVVALP